MLVSLFYPSLYAYTGHFSAKCQNDTSKVSEHTQVVRSGGLPCLFSALLVSTTMLSFFDMSGKLFFDIAFHQRNMLA